MLKETKEEKREEDEQWKEQQIKSLGRAEW